MKKTCLTLCCFLLSIGGLSAQTTQLENSYLMRQVTLSPYLHTNQVVNKEAKSTLNVPDPQEFVLRISEGTDKVGTDQWLTSKDFRVVGHQFYTANNKAQGLKVSLIHDAHQLKVDVHYELPSNKPYIYKYLTITSGKKITLERIDIDAIYMEGAYQPYKESQITAYGNGKWRPGLGQPLYNYINSTYWGVEFPAALNKVVDQEIRLGYMWGKEIQPNQPYTTYKSVMGVSDCTKYLDDAFFSYIDDVRVRPLRFRLQFNSWFDQGYEVDEKGFLASSKLIHKELCEKRGVRPFDSYVIDDGWQDNLLPNFDKDGEVWVTNNKFSKDFKESHKVLNKLGSGVGLWLSPASCFRAVPQVEVLRKKGFEALSICMSMTGEKYMNKLEERVLKLTKQGINYFKFDGSFGHLIIRDFELNGRGTPSMPQLPTEGFAPDDERLNNTMYDELKLYHLTAGTERLIQMMKHQHELNPNIYTAITNGAYLSPWWLQHTDAVWLVNCGDAAGGSNRTEEMVYRDGVYYEAFHDENTKFPLHSVWNHEPKKVTTGESEEEFRDYLFMHLSRGTGFLELYIKPDQLSASDWNVMADGIKWVESVFPTFRTAKMFGGNPRRRAVYGYTGWNAKKGYISMHNPSNKVQKITVTLDRSMGVSKDVKEFALSSPIKGDTEGLKKSWNFGDELTIELQPREIRILNFDK